MSHFQSSMCNFTAIETNVVSTPAELDSGLTNLYSSIIRENNEAGIKCVVGLGLIKMNDGVKVDGLSFATARNCLRIHLGSFCCPKSLPRALCKFLQLPDLTFVGVGIKHILDALENSYGVTCLNAVDLRSLAVAVEGDNRLGSFGLIDLGRRVCNIRVSPDVLDQYMNAVLFAQDTVKANVRIDVGSGWYVEAGTVDTHLAFMIGNRLLGGSMPYNIFRYNK